MTDAKTAIAIPSARQFRAIRAWLGISQGFAATRAGVSLSTIVDFETGKRATSQDRRQAIARMCHDLGIRFEGSNLVLPE